jgi:diguanylate cyclase (GGDEF)-like protein
VRWFLDIGNDPAISVAQVANLHRQIPLLYGLLLINSLAVAITHRTDTPAWLTVSVPAVLFSVTAVRMVHWIRVPKDVASSPQAAKRQLRLMTFAAGLISVAYVSWALALLPYGGPLEQAHVAFFIATTVIACIFCLVVLPQAAVVTAVAVLPAFIIMCFNRHQMVFATIGINVALVLGVLLRAVLNSFEHFRQLVLSRYILSEQHRKLQQLNEDNHNLALSDSLTSLPNRRRFYADLQELTESPSKSSFAVGVLDLDRFKPVNDTYGHQIGDRLLTAIGRRLRETAGAAARVYRLGGDEFGLIYFDDTAFEQACERILQQIQAPLHIGEIVIGIRASLGIAQYPDAGTTASELFDRADYALYHAKRANGGGVCVFTASLENAVRADRAVEVALQASCFEDELSVVLQPIVELSSGQLAAVEVLARWTSPVVGQVSPAEFIAIAERSTVIHSITKTVIRKGLQAARKLPDHVSVSFNISACDLNSATTLAFIRGEIESAGVTPERIWIEVTETAVMRNAEAAADALRAFRTLGVRIALDDFGTGYSSLSSVHLLPLDKVKIDRSFVGNLGSREGRTITSAVITLCHTVGLTCVAEGVETAEQRDFLKAAGCEQAQGYLISKPLPVDELLQWAGQLHQEQRSGDCDPGFEQGSWSDRQKAV